ncbi:MarR family winged helix-turn-helix transcriptional regulator [Clostridioides difficile]|uniref:MarR family winged helix-turn-helix transcriptional regulator n=1 Tax=Clostridioides difficile TaxID=1496 RepID=UPI0018E9F51E
MHEQIDYCERKKIRTINIKGENMRELLKWVSIINRYNTNYIERKLADIGINNSQYFYVLHICNNPGITQDTIFEKILVNPSNITRALANLEKEGFITREPGVKDKRTWHLYPTEKSLECYDEILKITNGYVEELLSSFEKEEQELFMSMLKKVAFLAIDMNEEAKLEAKENGRKI